VTSARRPRLLLAIACAAQFICVLDASIVNVALPSVQESLGLSATGLQWVVTSYTLTFAGFLLLGGRLGDVWGRKRAFIGGQVIFAAASLAAGLAVEGWQLVAARFVQGIGGAVLVPTTLSLVTSGFTEARPRARALSLLTAAAAAGGGLGAVIGGVLTGLLSWRWVFFVNVPLGAVLVVAAAWALPGRPPHHVRGRLDLPGSFSVTVGSAALVGTVVLGEERGWSSPPTVACALLAAAALAVFIVVERRAEQPIVPLAVFRVRPVAVANALAALTSGVLPATMFFLALYVQQVLGLDPLLAGLALSPGAIGIAVGARAASRWIEPLGARALFILGCLTATLGLVWLSGIDVGGRYAWDVLPPLVIVMAGFGAAGLPLTVTATSGLSVDRAGLASGLLSAARQVGSAVGLAALVAVAASRSDVDSPEALTDGFELGLLVAAGLFATACLAGLALPGRISVVDAGHTEEPAGARRQLS
jgi:EmrB/QacA subfamily drug resistance transporter